MFTFVFRPSCGPLRAQEGVRDWHALANGVCTGTGIFKQYVMLTALTPPNLTHTAFLDGITMDILRGFQGMGAAAAIPAAVRRIAFLFSPSVILMLPASHSSVFSRTRSRLRAADPWRSRRLPRVPR